jgi:single-strand DNA-binding protein
MARSLNKVQLIGRLGRDPEMRYTSNGSALVTFTLATNRTWANGDGTPHEEVEWHNIAAWGPLAETCNEYLRKGRLTYVEGRLQTRAWEDEHGTKRTRTEIVADDVIFLDSHTGDEPDPPDADLAEAMSEPSVVPATPRSARTRH